MAEAVAEVPASNPVQFWDFSSPGFDIENVRNDLETKGVAVISNIIPQSDCDEYIQQLNEWLAEFRDNFPSNIGSIIHKYSIAHIEPAWRVRLQVKAAFAGLWKTEKLLSSTDGVAIGRPPEIGGTDFGDRVVSKDLHFDQGQRRQGLHAFQGAVYLEEATMDDWCFCVMENSNQHHGTFFETYSSGRSEFRKLNDNEVDFLKDRGCSVKRIPVPKGGLVLWDSRTVHAGAPPVFGRAHPDRWRYIVFVSQTPAIWATDKDMACKREAYFEMKCSRHWSSRGASNFRTRKSGHDIVELPEIATTEEAKLLAGVEMYDFDDGKPNGPRLDMEMGATF